MVEIEGLEGTERLNNVGSDWMSDSPLDIYISNPHSFEVMSELPENDMYPEDLMDDIQSLKNGCMGYSVEPDVLDDIILHDDIISTPYKDDVVKISLSPENLYCLINIVKSYSVNVSKCETLELNDLFNIQTTCAGIVNQLDGRLDYYVKKRPWQPLLTKWIDSIGKTKVRKSGEE